MINTTENFGDFILKTEICETFGEEELCVTFKLYHNDSEIYKTFELGTLISMGRNISECYNSFSVLISNIENAENFDDLADLSIEWKLSFDVLKVLTNRFLNKQKNK
jgi:hypothetical protein